MDSVCDLYFRKLGKSIVNVYLKQCYKQASTFQACAPGLGLMSPKKAQVMCLNPTPEIQGPLQKEMGPAWEEVACQIVFKQLLFTFCS